MLQNRHSPNDPTLRALFDVHSLHHEFLESKKLLWNHRARIAFTETLSLLRVRLEVLLYAAFAASCLAQLSFHVLNYDAAWLIGTMFWLGVTTLFSLGTLVLLTFVKTYTSSHPLLHLLDPDTFFSSDHSLDLLTQKIAAYIELHTAHSLMTRRTLSHLAADLTICRKLQERFSAREEREKINETALFIDRWIRGLRIMLSHIGAVVHHPPLKGHIAREYTRLLYGRPCSTVIMNQITDTINECYETCEALCSYTEFFSRAVRDKVFPAESVLDRCDLILNLPELDQMYDRVMESSECCFDDTLSEVQ